MKLPWLDLLVLLVIVVGAASVARSSLTRRELQSEVERLEKITGKLSVDDPSRVYIRGMQTDDPLEFAWRVYLPKNFRYVVNNTRRGSSSGSYSEARQFIARVRIRELPDGLYVYQAFSGSSSFHGHPKELATFLHDRWDQLQIEQFARDKQESLDPQTGAAVLLRLSPSDELLLAANEDHAPPSVKLNLQPSLVEVRIGTPTSNP